MLFPPLPRRSSPRSSLVLFSLNAAYPSTTSPRRRRFAHLPTPHSRLPLSLLLPLSHLLPLYLSLTRLLHRLRVLLQTRVLWSGTRYAVVQEQMQMQMQGFAAEKRADEEVERVCKRGLWVAVVAEGAGRWLGRGKGGRAGSKNRLNTALTLLRAFLLVADTLWVLELG
ncbi:hypothetical protein JCM6882_006070 [Rhodosporidiobolus microsporus]